MKITALRRALNVAKSSLGSADGVLPILAHFCFMGDMLYAYNDITAVIVPEETGLTCALHGDTLLGILDATIGEDIDPKPAKDDVVLQFKSGKVKLPSLPEGAFIFDMPDDPVVFSLAISAAMEKALELCLGSVGSDTLQPHFTGVTILVVKGKATFYSTNNSTASRYICDDKIIARKDIAHVIPEIAVQQMLKMQKEHTAGKMEIGQTTMTVNYPYTKDGPAPVSLFSKLLEAVPDKFFTVFSTYADGVETFAIPPGLAEEVRKAQILLGKGGNDCFIEFQKDTVAVKAQGQMGTVDVRIPAPGMKGAGSLYVKPERVLKALGSADAIGINDGRCLLFTKGSYTHIVAGVAQTTEQLNDRNTAPPAEAGGTAAPRVREFVDKDSVPFSDMDDDIPF